MALISCVFITHAFEICKKQNFPCNDTVGTINSIFHLDFPQATDQEFSRKKSKNNFTFSLNLNDQYIFPTHKPSLGKQI